MIVAQSDIVVLDLATDRYLGLPGAIIADGTSVSVGGDLASVDPAAIEALAEAGLIVSGCSKPTRSIGLPDRAFDLDDRSLESPRLRDLLDLVIALSRVGWRLWQATPCRWHKTERSGSIGPASLEQLRVHLIRLRFLRLIVPTPRRCLPSALVTSLWLQRKGIECEIVFGVRTHPFEAHCWVEHAGIVLDDDLDRLRSYAPITIGHP